ncbi:hypothetical protein [Amycolatopsis magusensis]|uniref:Uncharacterized protein n=1 Tax=Amycolatopsis magusensis TaxID=882444 RepID=A0ABS4PU60_9PSEU|nr:hypothetical protein [Amycolatopsis magusensis]MBP2182969.1 hypothetical protein [Amycolatopsis magusensis]
MHVRSRRRSIRFDGSSVVISIAIKDSWNFPGDQKNRFPVSKISGISHQPPTTWRPGRVVFKVEGGSSEIVKNVPMFADKLSSYTFQYSAGQAGEVAKIVDAIKRARGK